MDKICQTKLNYSEEVCGNLTNHEEIQIIVQKHVTDYESLKNILGLAPRSSIPPCLSVSSIYVLLRVIFALFGGTFSDRHGRKAPMFCACLGQFLALSSHTINSIFITKLSWYFLYFELLDDLCGSYPLYYMMQYSFLVDVTAPEERYFKQIKDDVSLKILHQNIEDCHS